MGQGQGAVDQLTKSSRSPDQQVDPGFDGLALGSKRGLPVHRLGPQHGPLEEGPRFLRHLLGQFADRAQHQGTKALRGVDRATLDPGWGVVQEPLGEGDRVREGLPGSRGGQSHEVPFRGRRGGWPPGWASGTGCPSDLTNDHQWIQGKFVKRRLGHAYHYRWRLRVQPSWLSHWKTWTPPGLSGWSPGRPGTLGGGFPTSSGSRSRRGCAMSIKE